MAWSNMNISNFRHRVAVCSMKDVVIDGTTMELAREDIYRTWAQIDELEASMFSRLGFAIKEKVDDLTHIIYIRYRQDIDYTNTVWLYEQKLKSSPRWFKVQGTQDYTEVGRFMRFACRIVQQGGPITLPVPEGHVNPLDAKPLPASVRL